SVCYDRQPLPPSIWPATFLFIGFFFCQILLKQLCEGLQVYQLVDVTEKNPEHCPSLFVIGDMSESDTLKQVKEMQPLTFLQDFPMNPEGIEHLLIQGFFFIFYYFLHLSPAKHPHTITPPPPRCAVGNTHAEIIRSPTPHLTNTQEPKISNLDSRPKDRFLLV
uniref:Uncharacterized protein n=1 Tax=Oncorhynchus mykiss TaxID=8022 RepID=A0A8C7ST23_ONCMY